jgi:hypothetical protein
MGIPQEKASGDYSSFLATVTLWAIAKSYCARLLLKTFAIARCFGSTMVLSPENEE